MEVQILRDTTHTDADNNAGPWETGSFSTLSMRTGKANRQVRLVTSLLYHLLRSLSLCSETLPPE
ncbi:P6 [red clover-associated luteovirus]|uniref:P6 n=1 Tax=red clover-associated luteovirus TaxID=2734354 RepID=A0A3G1PZ42_9TOMB|nr:P6 [red clover-associated luteovirus]AVX32316.1 P6 [red clover-associated luteovirus]AVX32321.1 P6 [red clover-associated luteovirus]AVX32327.1 putative protein P6 [red clover-associated luteovirus]